MIINKTLLKNNILNLLISSIIMLFLFSRYFISLQNAYFSVVEDWKIFMSLSIYILLLISFIKFKYNLKNIIYLLLFILFTLLYQTHEYFSITHILFFFISIYLVELYIINKKKVLNLFFYSGLLYLFLLFYLILDGKGFTLFFDESINGRNYIGSVLTVFVLSGLALVTLKSKFFTSLGIVTILILKFRTSIISFSLFAFLKYKSNKNFYLVLFIFILTVEVTMGVGSIIFKWGDGASVTSGRTEPWIYYIDFIVNNFPQSLLPYVFTEANLNLPVYSYFSHATGLHHAPHNLFIDLFYRLGIVFGTVLILLLLLPIFYSKKHILERNLYIALLVFGMFEPSLGFATNLISLFFYMLLFYLYINMKFTWRKNEKTINSNN
jgi:hypothetical protein